MQKNENRPGYKNTKVGWIPEDWAVKTLGSVATYTNGKAHESSINPTGQYVVVNSKFISTSGLVRKYSNDCFLPAERGDVLMVMSDVPNGRAIARCFLVDKDDFYTVNQRICLLHPTQINETLLYYKLDRNPYYLAFDDGAKQTNLRKDDVISCPLAIPPLPEQEAIAGVLECWDKAIWGYEKKIEKKRNIKKGLMQRLLTGRKRLPGFGGGISYHEGHEGNEGKRIPEGWKEVRFGDVFSFVKTYALPRAQLTTDQTVSSDVYNIHYGDLHATYEGCMLDCTRETRIPRLKDNADLPIGAVLLEEGDLVIADASEDYDGVCACAELRNVGSKRITGGLHTFVARDTAGKTSHGYRGYILKEGSVSRELKHIATGVSVYGVSKSNLAKVKVSLPSVQEQQAIASVLFEADGEIGALERKLTVLKEQKRFLLNNLVTGNLRLPEFRRDQP